MQHFSCSRDVYAAARARPSSLLHTSLGDVTVRYPTTWHRATANPTNQSRHMLTFVIMPPQAKLAFPHGLVKTVWPSPHQKTKVRLPQWKFLSPFQLGLQTKKK